MGNNREQSHRVKDGHCFLDEQYRKGKVKADDYGHTLGFVHTQTGPDPTRLWPKPIINAGPVQIGTQTFLLGVAVRDRRYWIADGTRILHWKGARREKGVVSPRELGKERLLMWADAISRDFLSRIVTHAVARTVEPAIEAYRSLCRAHADATILDLARAGISRDRESFANGVSAEWTAENLTETKMPTLRHALYVALVLGLSAQHSAELIEHAAFLEYRVPLIDRTSASSIYQNARRLLATLCPSWWSRGNATDWVAVGSTIDGLFTAQWVRLVNEAEHRSVPITALTAVNAANVLQPDSEQFG